ncbi:hypothetical protein F4553_001641 [Allocatelliglobosispora scoriae]|uniref:Uncharacterized protein n=1 Tax=Allocatelliglobosispora scoriae TaxID=643052 RepID=A0A841BNE1_9ACTN|nr:hypothetical protein [Allocatelliglobosispora scoriae]MBB5868262.1 hypothetical protein [Allocatelliglobosispora scoriae]
MSLVDSVEKEFTLQTAVTRYDELRMRDALALQPLSADDALQMLALGEVIARKAGYGRQLSVRSARAAGASWAQIGAALGMSKQSAWESHARWISEQAEQHRRTGLEGFDAEQEAAARDLAGGSDEA